ncbi:hypothetical protein AVEN_19711-1 [Araneus ventricosus]|uniref:Uncharacterized protein n=1 Tax=Araneus ventricosus TaxID=182803 RepID=A0A4Y2C2M9_ARAVE|nr:hypothetical protein AVEN_19711-1 [Araneus ventricosus]
MLGHPLCTNFAITKLFVEYVMHSSFAYQQFNSNFTCGDPTILPLSSSTAEIVALLVTTCACPGRGKSLIFTRPPHSTDTTGIWCKVRDTTLRTPLSSCDKFLKNAPILCAEIG